MPDMKGITVKIPADLHAELKAYLEAHGMTTGEFIALAVDNELHPKIQIKEEQPMENMRTLAFQVPESLFQRVKAYLERNHMTQKQFVIGLIEAELEQDEAQYQAEHPEGQEDEEETQDGPDAGMEERPAGQENTAPVGDFEAGSEEVSQEDGWSEEQEEETQEDNEVEDTDIEEDNELGDAQEDEGAWDGETSDEESQDEEEEQAYQPSMGW
ncbi:putative uncharacterized protein [Clostridium sp. CAG:1013]|nr:putative uncharacterized protein [Clostridium sp. CAG:1013]